MIGTPSSRRAAALAADALVATYPLVLMDLTRERASVAAPGHAPVNQFAHAAAPPSAPLGPILNLDHDTVTSHAWLDLSAQPVLLWLPDLGNRYLAMHLYDAWAHPVTSFGTRTTGRAAQQIVLVGPWWSGPVPVGRPVVRLPTCTAWLLGHLRSDGPADERAVRALQSMIRLSPLGTRRPEGLDALRPPGAPAPAERPCPSTLVASPPASRLARMAPPEYFGTVARLLVDNPARPPDRSRLTRTLGALGVVPGEAPPWDDGHRPFLRAVARGMAEGLAHIQTAARAAVTTPWACPQDLDDPAGDALQHAASVWLGLGSWLREDGLFFTTGVDASGRPLDGGTRYVLRFGAGDTPPVHEFWSLTLHEDESFLIRQDRGPTSLGDRDLLERDEDGGLTVRLQPDAPVEDGNWLRTPPGPFRLALRLYRPREEALTGQWHPPAVQLVPTPRRRLPFR